MSLLQGYILDRMNGKRGSCLKELDLWLSNLPLAEQQTVVFRFLKPDTSLALTPVAQEMSAAQHGLESTARQPKRQYQTSMKPTSRVSCNGPHAYSKVAYMQSINNVCSETFLPSVILFE